MGNGYWGVQYLRTTLIPQDHTRLFRQKQEVVPAVNEGPMTKGRNPYQDHPRCRVPMAQDRRKPGPEGPGFSGVAGLCG